MGLKSFIVATFAAVAIAGPIPDPLNVMRQAGPAAGQVITKCAAPGQIALAYDDGPSQYTQKLVDTLTAGGAKGTFFVTGSLYGMRSIHLHCSLKAPSNRSRMHLQPKERSSERLQSRSPDRIPHLVPPAELRLSLHQRPYIPDDAS
jgi:peptidoglycan/xylan/chitin deacetylase (PgdA/CDA1 family)